MILRKEEIRCVFCGNHGLDIYHSKTACTNCGHKVPDFEGIKFLGGYSSNDTFGLLEVISKIPAIKDPELIRSQLESNETVMKDRFKKAYADGEHKPNAGAPGSNEMAQAIRLREWAAFELLSADHDFEGKVCLDIGAGQGADSIRLVSRGAKLVCIDFNPISLRNGSLIVPEALWLGCSSEVLPFATNTFDYTIANAALHHIRNKRKSLDEMYRVTKPGGYIVLVSDPFSPSVSSQQEHLLQELAAFERHPMVMNGVNEGVIPLNWYLHFIERLDKQPKILTIKIHETSEIADKPTFWTLNQESKNYLSTRNGNISSLIRVSEKHFNEPVVNTEEIPTKPLLETIGDPRKSIHFLLPYLSLNKFDDFPFQYSSKFTLMNGWNVKQDFNSSWRKGYNRVRLFVTRSYVQRMDKVYVKKASMHTKEDLAVYVTFNGNRTTQIRLEGECSQEVPIYPNRLNLDRNVIEIGVMGENTNKGAIWGEYDQKNELLVKTTFL